MIKQAKNIVLNSLLGGVLSVSAAITAQAQQPVNSIEVLVNDEPISSFDINQRLRLVIAVSGGVRSEEEFLKVREQVIRSMVDERLQLQESATVDLVIDENQLDGFFERRAQGVGQNAQQFEEALAGIGSSKASMLKQMEAEIAWSQLVEGRLGPFVSVSEEEVEARIQKVFDNRGKFEYRLAEITLDVTSPEQEASVKANADQLAERIRSGSTFSDIAQQLSSSPTAAVGGDLGWSTLDDLNGAYATAANNVKVGEITDPIKTAGGFAIIAVVDRRRVLVADPLDTQVALRQLHLTPAKLEDADAVANFEATVGNLHANPRSCEGLENIQAAAGADGRLDIGAIRLRDLRGETRTAVEPLQVGQATQILKMDDGMRVLIVCGRQEPQVQEPDFDLIMQQLEQQRLSMMGRRYLRDLRRDAIIDYR
ncbi:MAG: peptidylprolyl isomerase [Kordiimonas sp.]